MASGLSLEDVAERAGLKTSTVARVLDARFAAKADVLCAIAEAIGGSITFTLDVDGARDARSPPRDLSPGRRSLA